MILVVGILITKAQTLYIPQIVARPAYTATVYQPLTCPVSAPDDWKSWLCSYRWFQNPARKVEQMQHNTTPPGNRFAMLTVGEELKYNDWVWIQGRGGMIHQARNRTFHVYANKTFTLVEPEDPYSEWVDDATGYMYNTYEIVSMYDIAANPVILQTCVGQPVTGRRLVILR
jgi:hypothetical protein